MQSNSRMVEPIVLILIRGSTRKELFYKAYSIEIKTHDSIRVLYFVCIFFSFFFLYNFGPTELKTCVYVFCHDNCIHVLEFLCFSTKKYIYTQNT